jgi:hypothetical protein
MSVESNPVTLKVSMLLRGKMPRRQLRDVEIVRIAWGEAIEEAACFTAMSKLLNPHLEHKLVILGDYDMFKIGNCSKTFGFKVERLGKPPTNSRDYDNPRFKYLSETIRPTLYVDSDMCPHQTFPSLPSYPAVTFGYGITMLDWMMRNSHIAMGEETGRFYNWFDAESLGITLKDFIDKWLFFPLLRVNAGLLYCDGKPEGNRIYRRALELHQKLCERDETLFYFGSGEIALTTVCKDHSDHVSAWSRNVKWNATHPLLDIEDFSLQVDVGMEEILETRSMNGCVVHSHLGYTSVKDPDFKRIFGKLSQSGWPLLEVRQGLVTIHDT